MALTVTTRSGKFVRDRSWSCSQHAYPASHECDCCDCDREWDCDECASAEWVDLFNEDGTPKMRELGYLEVMMRDGLVRGLSPQRPLLLERLANADGPVEWRDDVALPIVGTTRG